LRNFVAERLERPQLHQPHCALVSRGYEGGAEIILFQPRDLQTEIPESRDQTKASVFAGNPHPGDITVESAERRQNPQGVC
jgi:hypothetical protein